jgi:hypothetical protein
MKQMKMNRVAFLTSLDSLGSGLGFINKMDIIKLLK